MSASQRLEQYLTEVRQRLQAVVVARATAVVLFVALLVTVVAVLVLSDDGFPSGAMVVARVALVIALIVAAGAMLWRPLRALSPAYRAKTFERTLPAQNGRIETYLELAKRRDEGAPPSLMTELLAEDALRLADQQPVSTAVPPRTLWVPVGVAALGLVILVGLLTLGRGEWGFGTRNLWFGAAIPREQIALRAIAVKPGNATVRRNQDVPIHASISGFKPDRAEVFVKFGDAKAWERAPMRLGDDGRFEFTLYALREPLSYYVASNGTKSAEYRVSVIEAPRIEKMRLTYNYPAWTGLEPETDEVNRDINAVAGTQVSVEIQTSAPLESPTLVVDKSNSDLKAEGGWTRGVIDVQKPGTYRITARVGDELVPLTDEQQISIIEDQRPTIEFGKPGRDWQASSIEEVPVEVHARDDFRVQNVELHYSVNGGEWKVAPLKAGGKDVTGDTILRLEEMGELQGKAASAKGASGTEDAEPSRLTPGDLVTYYAVAKDRKQAVQTDLFLIHVQPFERRFTQGQAGGMQGGGGGGDDQQNAISQRQREILLATWNLKRLRERPDNARERERLDENARMLSEAQGTLAEQAQTLIDRAAARGVDSADPKNRELIENLEQAAKAMQPAAKDLGNVRLAEAIPSEQKALQHLMRAEALFSDIQVQFRNSSAGGGNAGNAGRDLAEMFELEMDLDKNQYETQSRASNDDQSQQLTDTLRKLRELAQRQERLAREAARQQQQMRESDRWKQEQLKRETEDLRKKLAELAQQQNQQGQQSQPGRGQGQSSSSASNAQQALNQIEQALKNMQGDPNSQGQEGQNQQARSQQGQSQGGQPSGNQSANGGQSSSGGSQSQNNARQAQLASRDLKQALEKLEQGRREGMAGSFDHLANRARQMLEEQRRGESELLNAYAQPGQQGSQGIPQGPGSNPQNSQGPGRQRGLSWDRAEALAEQKRALQSELESLQRDMQASAQSHKDDAPDASKRIGTAASDLAESNLSQGLARSAIELERGRGLQAATRERLITESMENLQKDLDEASRIAANEARKRGTDKSDATPEELLAELSELRRAWAQAQADATRRGAFGPNGERPALDANGRPTGPGADPNARDANGRRLADARSAGGARREGEPDNGSDSDGQQQNGQPGGDRPGDSPNGAKASQGSQGASQSGGSNAGGSDTRTAGGSWNPNSGGGNWNGGGANTWGGYAHPWIEGDRGRLNGWSPPIPSSALRPWSESAEFRQQSEEIGKRLRDMLNRMPQNSLAPADLSALRRLANQLRRSGTDPMESEYKNMVNLVDQLELAALSASEKARASAPTHTDRPTVDSPEYRETVAEYYRRLGGAGTQQ